MTCFSDAIAQKKNSTIVLTDEVKLTGEIEKFNAAKHRIDTCTNEFANKYICRIDGRKWYGSDQGLELPRNQLNKLKIYINNKPVVLNVSQMFNPRYGYELNSEHFKVIRKKSVYYLYGFFSDGAGTYTAHWKIYNGKSSRLKISNDEKDFAWQTN